MTRANSDSDASGILKDSDRIAHGRKVLRAEAAAGRPKSLEACLSLSF